MNYAIVLGLFSLLGLFFFAPKELGQNNPDHEDWISLFNVSQEKFLSRSETAELLHVTEVTLNNWEKKNILIPKRIGGRVLYKETDVLSRLDDARDLYYNDIIVM